MNIIKKLDKCLDFLVNVVQKLKENDYWVIASDHHAEQNHYELIIQI